MSLTASQQTEISSYINSLRAKHKSPPIKWSHYISSIGQTWSDKLLATNMFQHSKNKKYGENLYYGCGYSLSDPVKLVKQAIDAWYSENKLYDYTKSTFMSGTGHFTCLVWKDVKEFGVGISVDPKTKKIIIVYNCDPPANMMGRFKDNVLPM